MKRKDVVIVILIPVILLIGYFMGAWLHPKIARHNIKNEPVLIDNLFGDSIVCLHSGKHVTIDTLSAHKKNLLVFWSPSCKFCRRFFQNSLNNNTVGVFCFPLTDDYEYIDYFVNQHGIDYPQLVKRTDDVNKPVDAPFVRAIPTFYVVDNHGNILQNKIGISDIDELISGLFENKAKD